jgi:PAS domain S-box-containing protein
MQDRGMSSAGATSDAVGDDRFRLAMASAATGMAILDAGGRWVEVNPALERMLGMPAADLLGQAATASMPAKEAGELSAAITRLLDGGLPAFDSEGRFLRGDGGELRVHLDLAPMPGPGGKPLYLVAHVHDIAARRHAMLARVSALEQRLSESGTALAALSRLQESFAHGVSHDLRAPLRAVDSFSALLSSHLDDRLDETARDYLARIRGATARMSSLIDSLLELSRAMRAELHPAPVDIGLLADWAHAELADAEPGRAAGLVVQPGLQVYGDERQLRQMMGQLLGNAWKFSRDRDRVHVEIAGERDGARIVLSVRDQGCGFDMRYADKLFEPFQRLHGPEQAAGNGIGLAIVRCIVERHGGRAWAQSEPGTGSTFFIELPAVPDADAEDSA